MKPKIVVTREIFDDVIGYLQQHCEVDHNQSDEPYTPDALAARLAGCDGLNYWPGRTRADDARHRHIPIKTQ